MTLVTPSLATIFVVLFLTGCSKPLHSGMSFGEIRSVVRSEFTIGMGSGEVLSGIKNLKLERRQSNILKAEEKPWIAATVPPKRGNPLDWARYSDGKLTFWLDGHEQLAFVEYLAPFAHRKRNGGWWSDKPVVLIGVEQ